MSNLQTIPEPNFERRAGLRDRRMEPSLNYPIEFERRSGVRERRAKLFDLFNRERIKYPGFEIFDGNDAGTLKESLSTFETMLGDSVALATDKGIDYKDWNEDRVGFDSENNLVVVTDGMGGYSGGAKAAQILMEEILKLPDDISFAVENAQSVMEEGDLGSGGACFISAKVVRSIDGEKFLHVAQAGDVKLLVFDQKGNIAYESTDQSLVQQSVDRGYITQDQALYSPDRHVITNVIQSYKGTADIIDPIPLKKGYRVVVMSDGVSDNLTPDEIWELIKNKTPEQAIDEISDVTDERMKQATTLGSEIDERRKKATFSDGFKSMPKKDNRALVIMDIA